MARMKNVDRIRETIVEGPPMPKQNRMSSSIKRKLRGRLGTEGSQWINCLENPELGACKIPDLTAIPTGTFQITQDQTYTPNTDGSVAVVVNPLLGQYAAAANTFASNTTTTGVWSSPSNLIGYAAADAIYGWCRVTSGKIDVEYLGATGTDSGQVCAALIKGPASQWGSAALMNASANSLIPAGFSALSGSSMSQTYPVRNGIRVLWRPTDPQDLVFWRMGIAGSFANLTEWNTPIMIIGVVGLAVNPSTIRVRIVINYEAIPSADTSNLVQAAPSPINLSSVATAFQWGQNLADKVVPLFGGWSQVATGASQLAYAGMANMVGNRNQGQRNVVRAIRY
jgi:hypothetical protein